MKEDKQNKEGDPIFSKEELTLKESLQDAKKREQVGKLLSDTHTSLKMRYFVILWSQIIDKLIFWKSAVS